MPPTPPTLPCPTNPCLTSYTVTVSNCCTLIANQLDKPGGNTLSNLMPSLPCDARFYKFVNTNQTWNTTTYSTLSGWANGAITLNPGEGAWLCPCCTQPFTITFTGCPHVPVLPINVPAGQAYLLSRQTNGIGTYENITGLTPPDGAQVFKWNNCGYSACTYSSLFGWDITPVAAVGEAMWFLPSGGVPPTIPSVPCPTNAITNYTVTVSKCCTLIANQLNHPGGNTLSNIMPTLPCDARLYKWSNGSQAWVATTYSTVSGWGNGAITLNPGEGAYLCSCLCSNCTTGFTVTFTGTVPTPVLPVTLLPGHYYLLSRQYPGPGNYTNIVGLEPEDDTMAFTLNQCAFTAHTYLGSLGGWDTEPITAVGEAMWIYTPPPGSGLPPMPDIQCPPILHARLSSTNTILLSWHSPCYQLQKNFRLDSAPSWRDVTNVPVLVGDEYHVSLDELGGEVVEWCSYLFATSLSATSCTNLFSNPPLYVGHCINWFVTNILECPYKNCGEYVTNTCPNYTNVYSWCSNHLFHTTGYGWYLTNLNGGVPPTEPGSHGPVFLATNEPTFFRLRLK